MGCNSCRPYRDYDNYRGRGRDDFYGTPYGPHRGRRHHRDDYRPYPPRPFFFGFPRFF